MINILFYMFSLPGEKKKKFFKKKLEALIFSFPYWEILDLSITGLVPTTSACARLTGERAVHIKIANSST